MSETLIITQKGNEIEINRTILANDTIPIIGTFKYSIGSRTESKSNAGTNINTSTWSIDKQSFSLTDTFKHEKDGSNQESKRTSTYSLSDNGKTLNIISYDTLPEGSITPENQRQMKHIYTKQ